MLREEKLKGESGTKTVLVTGSSRGLGLHIARQLSMSGFDVVLCARDKEVLAAAAAALGNCKWVAADLSDPIEAIRLIDEAKADCGVLVGIVCNVGGGDSVPPGLETFEEWQRVFAKNFFSLTNVVEAARDRIREGEECAIVCISSICGVESIVGAPVTYSVAKAAVNAYVSSASKSLGGKGIRINAVVPGNIMFEGSVWEQKLNAAPDSVAMMLKDEVPLSRLGRPDDIVNVVEFLLSERASFVSGSAWVVDGGQTRSF